MLSMLAFIVSIPISFTNIEPKVFFVSSVLLCFALFVFGLMDDSITNISYLTRLQRGIYFSIVSNLIFGLSAFAWGWLVPIGDARVVITGAAISMLFMIAACHIFFKNLKRIVDLVKEADKRST